jgi:hypothetical protein
MDLSGHKHEFKSKAEKWFNKSEKLIKEKDVYTRFLYLWMAFNTLFNFYGDIKTYKNFLLDPKPISPPPVDIRRYYRMQK